MSQKSPYRTLKGLKEKCYSMWCFLNDIEERFGDDFAALYARFKQEIRKQFGDLRYKATWERAWASLDVKVTWAGFDNTSFLVKYFSSAYSNGWDHLLPLVLDEFLRDEEALACIKDGFESVVQRSPHAAFTQERQLFNAVQEALQRQEVTANQTRLPAFA